jgi:hypothetical protein
MEPAIGPLRISIAGDDACGSGSVRFVDRAATGEDCLATASEELLETGWQDTSRHPQKISHGGKVVSVDRSSTMFTLPVEGNAAREPPPLSMPAVRGRPRVPGRIEGGFLRARPLARRVPKVDRCKLL